ncbi:hypothetical protein A3I27_04490 [Candidatus Giovannonibacteria bacterium RIFCSPLOWO2_02_FULL_43_11b]|uniref:R3H domain-containing protein n=1 Tax=Candidatus Giovannonibacteria bacterium RIFCSPHIGHO2_12_FULL_43_15 TaxID=1798341 RepID=A0A1F5WPD1_9BACT|nr:MAG: hypothetical protein A2739_01520 [Candidatus Giovannonibacteria bacterium RIFCSPHIGHO2_01_FULL_43_100]OGF66747.1 MAG: hypothetical protein A3B97_02430 [Candidatus Giovannonibacteria bacterium RIFCSPHIGHO2_02_FULL_43_32]OGF77523.1 MAG: hypothetical protein A3F23_00925 [Candidatus Giovannonibacteria bacterium RIFCSPHIGHO2_12_FULL_43_15]OGF78984.1 MAG: hypothetical protein A3A15_00550 [Candidatus Giovannonibacteria bacterium RIFCSPLOWO2_01_FULL_43_60]OGF89967.1 MAG: hypothetical protein A3
MDQEKEKIKEIIEELLAKIGVFGGVSIFETADNTQFQIRTQEAGLLIGEGGENLIALNHLLKRITEAKLGKVSFPFSIDVNDYQKQRAEEIKDLARLSAQRVRYFKKEIQLRPMSSYERRIVHAILTEYPDITTKSIGEEPNRKVVIKPFGVN